MSRITALTRETAPAAARGLLDNAKKQLGTVPNMFGVLANSPAALEGYLALNGALAKGALPAATRERIAIAIAEENGCSYCLSAHTYIGRNLVKLDDAELAANREGRSTDPHAEAAVRFALQLVRARGHVGEEAVRAVREAGYDDAQIVEVILHVALNTLTNYLNVASGTAIDFPVLTTRKEAA